MLTAYHLVHVYSELVAPASSFFAVTISAKDAASVVNVLPIELLSTNTSEIEPSAPTANCISQLANVKVPAVYD